MISQILCRLLAVFFLKESLASAGEKYRSTLIVYVPDVRQAKRLCLPVDETKQLLIDWIESYDKQDFYFWTIELKDSHELVGDISVVSLDEATESVELGYGIGSRWWGKGITAEAGRALVKFFFEEVKVKRVYAKHAAGNPNSGSVMQKMGMKKEGIIRQSGTCNQGIVDEVYYSILRNEYFSNDN